MGKQGSGTKSKVPEIFAAELRAAAMTICKKIEMGLNITDACRAAGISQPTYYAWVKRAREGHNNPIYAEVAEQFENARARGQAKLAEKIVEHADKDWRAAAFILERRHPEEWGKKSEIAHNMNGQVDLVVATRIGPDGRIEKTQSSAADVQSMIMDAIPDDEKRALGIEDAELTDEDLLVEVGDDNA